MPSHIAENNTVILPDGRFDAVVIATCRTPQDAEFIAACYRAFANVGDTTRAWLLEGGIIPGAAKEFEAEAERVARRLFEQAAMDAAERAGAGESLSTLTDAEEAAQRR